MPLLSVILLIEHDCPYSLISSMYPEITITCWDSGFTYIIIVEGLGDDKVIFQHDFSECFPETEFIELEGKLLIVHKVSEKDREGVTNLMAKFDCWYTQPCVIHSGQEVYRIFSWKRDNFSRLVNSIREMGGKVELKSIGSSSIDGYTESMIVTMSQLLSGMTSKQVEVLAYALRRGYFNQPSRVNTAELADSLHISPSTLTEHLRKAEAKLLTNLHPLLELILKEHDTSH